MKSREVFYITIIAALVATCAGLYQFRWAPAHAIAIYYNHDTQANQQIIKLIQESDRFIYFGIYTFTRTDIKEALIGARLRGVDVRGIVDRNQTANSDLQTKIVNELRKNNIPIAEQDHMGIMHLKALVTDHGYASGSYNWTSAATNLNDEILEIGHDETVRAQYERTIKKIIDKYTR